MAGPATGGALLAHTIAGLLDSRRSLTHPPCSFAPFTHDAGGGLTLRPFYRAELKGKRVLLADDVRNTGETFARAAALARDAGATVLATVEIYDRLEAIKRPRRAEHLAGGIQGAGKLQGRASVRSARTACRSRDSESCGLTSRLKARIAWRGVRRRCPSAPRSMSALSIRIFRCRTACQSWRKSS